ncbi:MAG: putative Na+/H+ antiporter [Terrimicrobiaceae bacterium]|nr:putative Na+/H+ antiporter [Terrimicrobiaceae bacterium]
MASFPGFMKKWVFILVAGGTPWFPMAHAATPDRADSPTPVERYEDSGEANLWAKLGGRVQKDPFNAVATIFFLCAIAHTFLAARFRKVSHHFERECRAINRKLAGEHSRGLQQAGDREKFLAVLFHFLGEVEAVFGIWVIPLAVAMTVMKGAGTASVYINGVNFTEPIFVLVIMAIASSRPVLFFAEACLRLVANLGRGTPAAWWLALLTAGPLLGSFVTEPAAMTICAMLLVAKFYNLEPSMPLRYATLGLLFVNISVGGTLTHFAAPPVVMVATKWDWNMAFMLGNFGWKAALGIVVCNLLAFLVFRRELLSLRDTGEDRDKRRPRVPGWIVGAHLLFIGFVVYASHYAAVVVLTFMLFQAFVMATERNQDLINLKSPILVGFFLAGLVIHGGCQEWWIEPVLTSLNPLQLLLGSTLLTAFNDNAAITYLASLVPGFSAQAKFAVMAGAVAGGGLTVIANAPNPAGQSILQDHFGTNGVDAVKLLLAALPPTVIMILAFLFLP